MRDCWKNKKKIWLILLFAAAFVVTLCVSLCVNSNFVSEAKYFLKASDSYCEYSGQALLQAQSYGCRRLEDNQYIATEDDHFLILGIDPIDITLLTIELSDPAEQDMNFQLYYSVDGLSFSEENSVMGLIEQGQETITLDLHVRNISSLRLDIGNQTGDIFGLSAIKINENVGSGAWRALQNVAWAKVCFWCLLSFFCICFILLHWLFPVRKLYEQVYRKRWLIALGILIFLVAFKAHGDSIGIYSDNIQPDYETDYSQPIFGETRSIRSDEWLVEAPAILASTYGENTFGQYNNILRGTETVNGIFGISLDYGTLGKGIWKFSYAVLPVEYAYSLCWYTPIILGFMLAFELFMIIARKRRLLALAGASMVVLSSFAFWWGFPGPLLGMMASVVSAYHFIDKKKLRQRILLAVGFAISLAYFILTFYPAWQVPMGYIALVIAIAVIHDKWSNIRAFTKTDVFLIVLAIAFSASIVLWFVMNNMDYYQAILNTVYPGHNTVTEGSVGGGMTSGLFTYAESWFFGYAQAVNPSELGTFFSMFPIPVVFAIYNLFRNKKKDWLTCGLLILSALLVVYNTVGLPSMISRITLLSFSAPARCVPILALTQVFLLIRTLSLPKEELKRMPVWCAILISVATAALAIWVLRSTDDYLTSPMAAVSFFVIVVFGSWVMAGKNLFSQNVLAVVLSAFSLVGIAAVRPITLGLDAIFAKPAASEIQSICEKEDTLWLAYSTDAGLIVSGYTAACGAPTINSTNVYPNMELWEKLDPEGEYEDVYNRYAHVVIDFTTDATSFELFDKDVFFLHLSYKDIEKTGVNYIFALEELTSQSPDVSFDLAYSEDGTYIYHVIYN